MRKRSKVLTLLLVLCMIVSMFLVGCKAETTDNSSEGTEVADTTQTQVESEQEDSPYKKFDEPVTVSWYFPGEKQEDDEVVWAAFNERLSELTNITVEFNRLDWAAYQDQMTMIFAGNEEMDICFTASWFNSFYENVAKGAFLPLDYFLENEASALKESLPEFLLPAGEYKGQVYAIPNYQVMFTQWSMVVRKEYAEKYNLDVEGISSMTDMYEQAKAMEPFLEQVKEGEPDIFPIAHDVQWIDVLIERVPGTDVKIVAGDEDAHVMTYSEEREFGDRYLQLTMDWFEKGYMRPDAASLTDITMIDADKHSHKYAAFCIPYKPGGLVECNNKYSDEFIEIPMGQPYIAAKAGDGTMNAISRTSKNPDAAITVMEVMNLDKELFNLFLFGIEGEHYTKLTDNTVQIIEDGGYSYGNVAWMFGNQFNAYYMEGQEEGTWELTDKLNREAVVSPLRGFSPDLEPLKNVLPQVRTLIVSGTNSHYAFSDKRDEYVTYMDEQEEKLVTAGYDEIVAEMQKQIDAWMAGK